MARVLVVPYAPCGLICNSVQDSSSPAFLVVVALCIRRKGLSYVNVNRDFAWSLLHIRMNCIELSTLLWGVEVGSGIDHWLRRGKYGE